MYFQETHGLQVLLSVLKVKVNVPVYPIDLFIEWGKSGTFSIMSRIYPRDNKTKGQNWDVLLLVEKRARVVELMSIEDFFFSISFSFHHLNC